MISRHHGPSTDEITVLQLSGAGRLVVALNTCELDVNSPLATPGHRYGIVNKHVCTLNVSSIVSN